jgi:hypothetical protein
VHGEKLRELFLACRRVAELTQDLLAFWGGVSATGYKPRSYLVPAPIMTGMLHFGTEDQPNSQISEFRKQLLALGLLR